MFASLGSTQQTNKNKNRAQVFVLYLQIKLLYDSVIHYINTIKFSKPEAGWLRTELSDNFKDLDKEIPKLGFFDAQYKSTRVGYENKYQLLQMQNQMAVDAFDEDTVHFQAFHIEQSPDIRAGNPSHGQLSRLRVTQECCNGDIGQKSIPCAGSVVCTGNFVCIRNWRESSLSTAE